MQMLEMKATLLRSNPQAIRQFCVPMDFSMEKLHQLLTVLFGYADGSFYEFKRDEEVIDSRKDNNLQVSSVFHQNEVYIYSYGKKGERKIRLQYLQIKEIDAKVPIVTRSRGKIMPDFCRDISDFNERQAAWERSYNKYYFGYEDMQQEAEYYSFSAEKMNLELRMQFAPLDLKLDNNAVFKPDFSRCMSSAEIFDSWTINEIRVSAQRAGISVPSNLRKADLIHCMIRSYREPAVIKRIFKEITLMEYKGFQRACQEKVVYTNEDESYDTLLSYGMLCVRSANNEIICSKELVETYLSMLADGFEVKYIHFQTAACVIRAGCWLYGYLTEDIYHKLLESCYPGKLTDDEAAYYWEEYYRTRKRRENYVSGKRYYYSNNGIGKEAVHMLMESEKNRPMYIPAREELEKMENGGLTFDKNQKILENYLVNKLYVRDGSAYLYVKGMYDGLHLGASSESMVKWLFNSLRKRYGTNQENELKGLLGKAIGEVRQIEFGGYTREEMKRLTAINKSDKVKIMSNALCPCGSGRKYKMCCGRNQTV